MGLAKGNKSYKTFVKGFISEATPLTFPEDATIDESNFVLNKSGERERRLGMDFESGYATTDLTSLVSSDNINGISAFIWRAVGSSFSIDILVIHHGTSLSFFDANASVISNAPLNGGSTVDIGGDQVQEVQATSLFGKFIITNGQKGFLVLEYDADTDTVSVESRIILVRDIWGVDDTLSVAERPSSLSEEHEYNLVNQGWGKINPDDNGKNYYVGMKNISGEYPSNADIVSAGKDPTQYNRWYTEFVQRAFFGTTESPKGFFVIDTFRRGTCRDNLMIGKNLITKNTNLTGDYFSIDKFIQDKSDWIYTKRVNASPSFLLDETSGGITTTTSFAGRVWYAGENMFTENGDDRSPNLSSYIFFSQVVDNTDKLGKCYQSNDPTAEEAPDILDSDGGAIKIPDLTNIIKLTATGRSVIVFGENGIWEISGGESNFSATNFEIRKVSNVKLIAPKSVVDAEGAILFWAEEGIYALSIDPTSLRASVQNITQDTIQSWYFNLSAESKQRCKGVYDLAERKIRWLFGEKKNLSSIKLTSHPYPVEDIEVIAATLEEIVNNVVPYNVEAIDSSGPIITGGSIRVALVEYTDWPPEAIDSSGPTITSGFLNTDPLTIIEYEIPAEAIDSSGPTITNGSIRVALIQYTNYPAEAIDSSGPTITGGSLT